MYKVLKDFKGSPDGYTVVEYVAGTEVDLAPDLAKVAVKEKWVKELPAKPKPDPEAERRAAEEKAAAEAKAAEEAATAKAAAIADLQAKIAAASDSDKPALEAELATLTAE